VNGLEVDLGTWPFYVRLSIGGQFLCGGTIIQDEWVLTAAHCCALVLLGGEVEGATTVVNFNDYSFNTNFLEEFSLDVPATKVVNHPDYVGDETNKNNDYCLMGLPPGHGQSLQKACLPSADPIGGEACWVGGWGTTSFEGEVSQSMQSVGQNVFSQEYCIANTGYGSLEPDDICAGIPNSDGVDGADGGKDSCQGDSGGPLICPVDGKATVVGVVSRGGICAAQNNAGLYSSVHQARAWIDSTIAAGYDAI